MDRGFRMRESIGLLNKTEGMFRRYLDRRVSHTGVYPAQHKLLMELDRDPAFSQMKLAEKFGVSAAAITVSLKKLERGGYIVRQTDREDGRINHVQITEKGKEVVRRSLQIFAESDRLFFEGFSDGELEQFYSLLCRAKENMERAQQDISGGRRKGKEG